MERAGCFRNSAAAVVKFLTLQPLSFYEFLLANQKGTICEFIENSGLSPLSEDLHNTLSDLLKQYFIIGGMPQAVKTWLDTRDFSTVGAVQDNILETYQNDFSKHAPANLIPRLRFLWNSIPSQLARENKKFVYGLIREGARAREYEDALLWLQDSGLIRRVGRAQSLKQFRTKYGPELSIKTSLRSLNFRCGVLNLPLTLLWNLPSYLKAVFPD